jgi:hypothetical protein
VLNAARAAVHDDTDEDLARINAILVCEAFVSELADVGCMINRIPTEARVPHVEGPTGT